MARKDIVNNMKTFRFCYLLLAAGICLSANVARAERTWKISEDFQWGVTFGFYATNGYFSSSVAKDEIEAIARAGATWVTVVPTVWQDEGASAFQYKDFAHTPDDIELMDVIDLIHAKARSPAISRFAARRPRPSSVVGHGNKRKTL